jgi:hypothetical protein
LHDAEVARAKAFIEARYAASDVRSSFKSKLGDTIDCIDFFAQPGVKALARRGSPITQLPPPAEKPRRVGAVDDVSFDGSIDEDGNVRACTDTTVPQVRVTVDTILAAGGLDSYLERLVKDPVALKVAPPDSAGPAYAHAQSSYDGSTSAIPTDRATLSVWTPAIPSSDTIDHSLEQTWTISPGAQYKAGAPCAPNCQQTVEVGWIVYRGLNGDGNPHLFVFSTADGYQTGSYNGLGGGPSWVGTPNAAFAPGMTMTSSTSTPGSELTTQVNQCSLYGHCPGGWEILVRTAGQAALSSVGYYPTNDYSGTFRSSAAIFTAGGEVYDSRDLTANGGDTFALPMGNGNVASAGFGNAAYVHDLYVFAANQADPDLSFGTPSSTVPQYGVWPSGAMATPTPGSPEFEAGWLNYFYLGAPPPPCSPVTCASAGLTCGSASDGCGNTINCGTCASGETCSVNRCESCAPATCSSLGKDCGSWANGCGGEVSCGTCGGGMVCQSGVCVGSGGGGGTFCTNCRKTGGTCTTSGGKSVCIHE